MFFKSRLIARNTFKEVKTKTRRNEKWKLRRESKKYVRLLFDDGSIKNECLPEFNFKIISENSSEISAIKYKIL